jgi:hypothetical protein
MNIQITSRFTAPAFKTQARKAAMIANAAPSRHIQVYPDGEYEGQFNSYFEYREGYGVYTWKNGTVYAGEFKKDLMNGLGIIRLQNGDVYEGEWKNGKKHGFGFNHSSDG